MERYERYFSLGLMSLKEGMTFQVNTYDENGELVAGVENPEHSLFKCKEISKEEYDNYQRMLNDPNVPRGMAGGIINEKGIQNLQSFLKKKELQRIEMNEPQIALSAKKIKKMLNLGIIEDDDIEVEIKQQGMERFKEEIIRRVSLE